MQKSPKNLRRSKSLGQALLDTFLPTQYEPPPNRVRSQLVGWSGLPTDPYPTHPPYGWGQGQPPMF